MKIETKFKPGDKVWVIFEGKAKEFSIYKIGIEQYIAKAMTVNYILEITPRPNFSCKSYEEKECFEDCESLIKSLTE
jgi:hypothetical protein